MEPTLIDSNPENGNEAQETPIERNLTGKQFGRLTVVNGPVSKKKRNIASSMPPASASKAADGAAAATAAATSPPAPSKRSLKKQKISEKQKQPAWERAK